jgi:hypothetical protein
MLLLSCGAPAASRPAPLVAPSPPSARSGWTYEVVAGPGAQVLAVEASLAPGAGEELTVIDGAEPYVQGVEVATREGWARVPPSGRVWRAPSCARGCRVRYTYLLADAARANDDVSLARLDTDAIEAPPSTWLLRPVEAPAGTPYRFHVTTAPGEAFATGVLAPAKDPGAKDTYEAFAVDYYQLPYSAFGKLRVHLFEEGRVELAILPGALRSEDDVVEWTRTAARAVTGFYGHLPTQRLLVIVRPSRGDGIGMGTTMGHSGAAITVDVGAAISREELLHDWVLVHEMVHTALPDVLGPQHWLEEGLATYIEPQARARLGLVRVEDVWSEWVHGMPNGLPEPGDRGLDRTRTWGRTYWGGALFCFLADLEIRQRTNGQKSLGDALRAVNAASGGIAVSWPVERVLEVGDAAVGVPVLRELYTKMADAPVPVDLEAIWKRLGVVPQDRRVTFDDTAPLAQIRRSMLPPRSL